MIGGWEWVIIIIAILLIFGARRLPEIGKSLGQGIRAFKKELRGDSSNSPQEKPPASGDKSNSTS